MAHINKELLEKTIVDQDQMIFSMFGKKPIEIGDAKFTVEKAVQVARMMGMRDALVHIHNCLVDE